MRDPVATLVKARSKGDDHAEYITNATRNACHHLHIQLKSSRFKLKKARFDLELYTSIFMV